MPPTEITVKPARRQRGIRLTEWLRRRHLPLNTRCAERGLCTGCLVELVDAAGQSRQVRGCETSVVECQNLRVRIPERSLIAHRPQAVSEFHINVPQAHAPLVREGLGAAVDVGTTTVAVLLVDLTSGKIVGRATDFNRQAHYGDDVLTRINLCTGNPAMIAKLQTAVVKETIAPLLTEAGATNRLACITIAGNTTMLHLLAGVDPTPMGTVPFTPAFLDHRVIRLPGLGVANVHLLPGMSAYVGADLCAGVLASGLAYDDGPSLLVDVGTNGEIVLKSDGLLYGCATAAGPAFEGAGLTSGARAGPGAIERVRFDREPFAVHTKTIGRRKAVGVCGSGYIDLLAEGRRVGLLNERGRFATPDRLRLADRVFVTEADIAHLLQAKAAIAAGILTLLHRAGLEPPQVKMLYLAGGFGLHLDVTNAIACGMLPGFVPEQVQVIGNSSLAGAYLALLDNGVLDELRRLARELNVVELNLDPGFETRYIDQLTLPSPSRCF